MQNSKPFEGRVTLITGANGGIGTELVRAFSACGSNVVIHHLTTDGLDDVKAIARGNHVNYLSTKADIREPKEVATMMDAIHERFGRLDNFIGNAAHQVAKPFLDMSNEEIHAICRTNLEGTMFCSRDALKLMLSNQTSRVLAI